MKLPSYVLLFSSFVSMVAYPSLAEVPVRVGYLGNITHAQPLIGLSDGTFQNFVGKLGTVRPIVFNAGPSVIEAVFAGEIDFAYIGPNPAINAYIKSSGEAVRIVAGAASGGARLVVRKGSGIKKSEDFNGKKLATPQLGNTQDVAARNWLIQNGLNSLEKAGKVSVLPVKNADQLSLFQKGELDASWAIEPWATRLIHEAGAEEYLDERKLWKDGKFATTVVIVRAKFLRENPEVVQALLKAHVELTEKIRKDPKAAAAAVNVAVQKVTGKGLVEPVLKEAMSKIEFTHEPIESSIEKAAADAYQAGFLGRKKPVLEGLFDLTILRTIVSGKK